MSSISSSSTAKPTPNAAFRLQQPSPDSSARIPVTPAVLRSIFASSRSPYEERSISRIAFFRFAGFILSCLGISMIASRGKGIQSLDVV